MDKVIIASVEDRLTVAAILVKNDYTVRQGKQLRQGKKKLRILSGVHAERQAEAGGRGMRTQFCIYGEPRGKGNARNSQPYAAM